MYDILETPYSVICKEKPEQQDMEMSHALTMLVKDEYHYF